SSMASSHRVPTPTPARARSGIGGKSSAQQTVCRNPITGIADCCALAASGHAAAPPSSVINSRRCSWSNGIRSPTRAGTEHQDLEVAGVSGGLLGGPGGGIGGVSKLERPRRLSSGGHVGKRQTSIGRRETGRAGGRKPPTKENRQ